jgi:hypothetical protein
VPIPRRSVPRRARAALALAAALLAPACTGGTEQVAGQRPSATATGGGSLAGVCPATVVVQSNWWPQAEDGAMFSLLGGELTVDRQRKRVSGQLVSGGVDTGVRLEIRSGGPANGFVPAVSAMFTDQSITLGTADTDQIAQVAGQRRVKAVVGQLDRSPVVLMFDPTKHPDFKSIRDIGRADTRVLYFQGATYMAYLTGSGQLRPSQVDAGYTGTPDRWVASRGEIVQQGFLTNEPYAYEKELPAWDRKVAWLLVADSGYPVYPETLTVRADREAELAPCLRRLVPMIQRSMVDYVTNPAATNALIVRLAADFDAYPYSAARAAYAVSVMKANKIVGNGSNGTLGDFDQARVARLLEIVRPVFARSRQPLPAGLTAVDVVTNAYVDPAVGLS